ncbi:hypothetical protein [Caballeronia sp. PC1]|uniref:hypothetical protein n=1 Tax=unclassified Caballeronia TaxID=2646786 RepID=UPI0035C8298E
MKSLLSSIFYVLLTLCGCASKPKPPPEPDMAHLVSVNKATPVELEGKVILPPKTAVQQWKAGDAN